MKIKLLIIACLFSVITYAQTDTASLHTFLNSYITTNGSKAITGAILHNYLQMQNSACYNRTDDPNSSGVHAWDSNIAYLPGWACTKEDISSNQNL